MPDALPSAKSFAYRLTARRRAKHERAVRRLASSYMAASLRIALATEAESSGPADFVARATQAVATGGAERTRSMLLAVYAAVALPEAAAVASSAGLKWGGREIVQKRDAEERADLWLRRARTFLLARGAQKIRDISAVTAELVRASLARGLADGLGVADMGRRLRKEWAGLTRRRAVRIARTEVTNAAGWGSLEGARTVASSVGLVLDKEWVAARDGRERAEHGEADGQRVPLEEPFVVGGEELMHPGDGSLGASAANLVNCRCAHAFVPRDE